jgi:hypothetical protein
MLQGVLIAESLRVDAELKVDGLRCRRVVRRDVSATTAPTQPGVWTFMDFDAPDEMADALSAALATALEKEVGWYADFAAGDDHVVVFANRIFRYRRGDRAGREAAQAHGRSVGVPEHQLDWTE